MRKPPHRRLEPGIIERSRPILERHVAGRAARRQRIDGMGDGIEGDHSLPYRPWQRSRQRLGAEKVAGGISVLPEGTVVEDAVRGVLRDVLGLSEARAAAFTAGTPLFGALPELDLLAVAGILTEIEDRVGILIEDDEVDSEMLETFGALTKFVASKARG